MKIMPIRYDSKTYSIPKPMNQNNANPSFGAYRFDEAGCRLAKEKSIRNFKYWWEFLLNLSDKYVLVR